MSDANSDEMHGVEGTTELENALVAVELKLDETFEAAGRQALADDEAGAGPPAWGWRITTKSTPIAWRVKPVFSNDSPFSTLLPGVLILITSALRTLAASSKEMRVRVLGS